MKHSVRTFWRNADGAVAPIVALSLIGLIAVGGIAFDYARVASMDTELQDAADQAALAAASQLDHQTGACARAAAAANALLTNNTLFATGGLGIAVPTSGVADCTGNAAIQFYQSYDQQTDTPGAAATSDANARIVIVSITPRETQYFLTPVVAAFRSGNIGAQAVASLGSAICKMPPVMICNPAETAGNTAFNAANYIGDGLRLTSVGNGSGGWVPGNFGYLDTDITTVNGQTNQLRAALGWNTPPGFCVSSDSVDTKPGATVTVTDALNTRFDIYQNNNTSCLTGGSCSASMNSVKDVRRPANGNQCKFVNNGNGWQLDTSGAGYYGNNSMVISATTPLPTTTIPSSMGHPRDMCHALNGTGGTCTSGRIGDGKWDADAYFRTNYVRTVAGAGGAAGTRWAGGTGVGSWQANTGLSTTASRTIAGTNLPNPNYASRYNAYVWEMNHRDTLVDGVTVLAQRAPGATGNTLVSYGKPQCSASQGYGSGQVPNATTPDRRRISVAVVDCLANGVKGNSTGVPVEKWIDVFLVEPSLQRDRTNDGDMYVEIIGESLNGGPAGTVIHRDVPYLIK
jgi:Flp pilus assembly protein TadG